VKLWTVKYSFYHIACFQFFITIRKTNSVIYQLGNLTVLYITVRNKVQCYKIIRKIIYVI